MKEPTTLPGQPRQPACPWCSCSYPSSLLGAQELKMIALLPHWCLFKVQSQIQSHFCRGPWCTPHGHPSGVSLWWVQHSGTNSNLRGNSDQGNRAQPDTFLPIHIECLLRSTSSLPRGDPENKARKGEPMVRDMVFGTESLNRKLRPNAWGLWLHNRI